MQTLAHVNNDQNELRLALEVCLAITDSPDIFSASGPLLKILGKYSGMMQGALVLQDWPDKNLLVHTWYGPKGVEQEKKPVGAGIFGHRMEDMACPALFLRQVDDHYPAPIPLPTQAQPPVPKGKIAFFAVPVATRNGLAGYLIADRLFADSVPLADDIRLLQAVASMVAPAVEAQQGHHAAQNALLEENRRLHALLYSPLDTSSLAGQSGLLRLLQDDLHKASASHSPLLVCGEPGTGKETTAALVHQNSPRAGRPFIKVNCAAIPESRMESELFGIASENARPASENQIRGRFIQAHGGTLFLDEVGALKPVVQARLLSAIQEKAVMPVGGTSPRLADVRIVAASTHDLDSLVERGLFRQDLYYALGVFRVHLPPLRERKDDISSLVATFMDRHSPQKGRKTVRLADPVATALTTYAWPGNVRELENVIQRAMVLCGEEGLISMHHLPAALQTSVPDATPSGSLADAVAALEKRMITAALKASRGHMAKAAASLGVTERILGLRMRAYGLGFRDFRS